MVKPNFFVDKANIKLKPITFTKKYYGSMLEGAYNHLLSFVDSLLIIFCLDFTFIFCLFNSDTLQVLIFVCPTIKELRYHELSSYFFLYKLLEAAPLAFVLLG